jgi:TolB-like protein/tRNA A-37 threonylcarbamoyl transferase component Bud32
MPDSPNDETLAATTPYGEEGPPSSTEEHTFRPGDDVADRYRVVRFIARGGMGEVYEAEDRELRTRVALKTIRPEIAADPAMMERFRREIHLAHRITHPNVSRVYDLGFHRRDERSVTFLTMELLDGETLAARVARLGRLATGDALPIVVQMAAALDAAHEVGIIHRDFKSGNVMLVEADRNAPSKGLRAVVTDFGLARTASGQDGFAATMTGTGAVAGTPLYMAPEQVEGAELTAAADIYALGVVMYEMVTGKWPFVGDSAISTAVKRLKERPPSPRSRVPDLERRWESAILRCLERAPADRFAKAGDAARALAGERVAPKRSARRAALAAIAAIVVLAGGLGYYFARGRATTNVPVKSRRSVAVLGFKNLAGRPDAAWLSTALSEMLTTELSAGDTLRTVPGETVAKLKVSLALPDADSYAKDTLAKIRANIDAGYVVLGSYLAVAGAPVRVDLKVQDATAGETIAAVTESGTEAQLADLVSRVAVRLREKLGAGSLSPTQAAAIRAPCRRTPRPRGCTPRASPAAGLRLRRRPGPLREGGRLGSRPRALPGGARRHLPEPRRRGKGANVRAASRRALLEPLARGSSLDRGARARGDARVGQGDRGIPRPLLVRAGQPGVRPASSLRAEFRTTGERRAAEDHRRSPPITASLRRRSADRPRRGRSEQPGRRLQTREGAGRASGVQGA